LDAQHPSRIEWDSLPVPAVLANPVIEQWLTTVALDEVPRIPHLDFSTLFELVDHHDQKALHTPHILVENNQMGRLRLMTTTFLSDLRQHVLLGSSVLSTPYPVVDVPVVW
jgi:hypothetical protein